MVGVPCDSMQSFFVLFLNGWLFLYPNGTLEYVFGGCALYLWFVPSFVNNYPVLVFSYFLTLFGGDFCVTIGHIFLTIMGGARGVTGLIVGLYDVLAGNF